MPRSRWPKSRIFKLGFFLGRGLKPDEIAEQLDSTAHTVRKMANNMGGAFSDVPKGNLMIDVGGKIAGLANQARERSETVESFTSRLVRILADDPVLARNVLDDEL